MIQKVVKNSIEYEAYQYTGDYNIEIIEFCGPQNLYLGKDIPDEKYAELKDTVPWELFVKTTNDNDKKLSINDYIIKNSKNELFFCKFDDFIKKYQIIK